MILNMVRYTYFKTHASFKTKTINTYLLHFVTITHSNLLPHRNCEVVGKLRILTKVKLEPPLSLAPEEPKRQCSLFFFWKNKHYIRYL